MFSKYAQKINWRVPPIIIRGASSRQTLFVLTSIQSKLEAQNNIPFGSKTIEKGVTSDYSLYKTW